MWRSANVLRERFREVFLSRFAISRTKPMLWDGMKWTPMRLKLCVLYPRTLTEIEGKPSSRDLVTLARQGHFGKNIHIRNCQEFFNGTYSQTISGEFKQEISFILPARSFQGTVSYHLFHTETWIYAELIGPTDIWWQIGNLWLWNAWVLTCNTSWLLWKAWVLLVKFVLHNKLRAETMASA